MGESRGKKWEEKARWVAVAVIAALLGSVLIGPAMAHLNSPLTFAHLKKHFYTKKQADSRFINVGEKASDSNKLDGKNSTEFLATGAKAADSDKLDGQDGVAFLQNTQLGWAIVMANGTLVRGLNTTSAANLGSPGNYEVVFNRNVSQCAYQATVTQSTVGAEIGAEPRSTNVNAVFVTTWSSAGAPANMPFHLFVICA
jgi:hypothetical protein